MTTTIFRKAFPIALGASIGFAYWYFIGCSSGHCPITSTWEISTLYGAFAGASFLIGGKKKEPAVQKFNQD